MTSLFISNLLT